MAVTQRLELRQSQSLVMTPQLQQAIKLLQLSNVELTTYVEAELAGNPLLERAESGDGTTPERAAPDQRETTPNPERDLASQLTGERLPSEQAAPLDADYDNVYDNAAVDDWTSDATNPWPVHGCGERDGDHALEQRFSETKTLRQHLLDQLPLEIEAPVERVIGAYLIDALDETGYLRSDLAELAERLGCPSARIEAVLRRLQTFDPPGVFARDLKECLALQLADRDRLDPAMAALLDNLEQLAARDRAALLKLTGVDDEDLTEMIAEIRALDPKPGLAFDQRPVEPITPDILLRLLPNGIWAVELNSDTLPRVLVNERYSAEISGRLRGKAEREYVSERLQSANWLVKALHQRATTILKVSSEIVRQQDGFLRRGIQHMRPLTLREIAEAIGMHESTVSRVTSNKHIATPRGIFELKYFFTAAIAGDDGQFHSAESVRHRIRALIDGEAPKKILSDDQLVSLLRGDGIDIARRTVAKYREAMRIPSSVQRRREKAAAL